jgi:hypothetical protein
MSEETPSLHIDTDWKKQAQEEKRKLAEQEKAKKEAAPIASSGTSAATQTAPSAASSRSRGQREAPEASFSTLVQSLMTQSLFYLGDLTPRGAEPQVNLDMAKHQIDTLGVLEEKTKGNLTDDEKRLLDTALYEVRMRYVSVASQYIT